MISEEEDNLSARLFAVSHILKMVIGILVNSDPDVVEKISATVEGDLFRLIGDADDEDACRFAERYRTAAFWILEHPLIQDRLEDGGAPKPPL